MKPKRRRSNNIKQWYGSTQGNNMTAKRKPLPKYNTPVGVARYPHLNKPDTRFDDDGVYKCDLIFSASAPGVADLIEYLEGIRDAEFDKLDVKKQKTYSKAEVFEMELDDAGDETGNVIFKTKLNAVGKNNQTGDTWVNTPKLFDSVGNPLGEDAQIWSGSKLIIAGKVMAYAMGSTKSVGVSLKCDGVQVIELVSGGGQTADSFGFGAVSGGYQAPTTEAGLGNQPSDEAPESDDEDGDDDEF